MVNCKRCGKELRSAESIKRGMGKICYRISQLQKAKQPEQPEKLDMEELKSFISLEIEKALKDFNFSRPINNDKTEDIGIVSIKPAKKMPKFNPLETNKHLVVKELKEQLVKGIENMLKPMGSFDNQINFLEIPVLV